MHQDRSAAPGALARYSLLGVTVLGTMSNNIINVPLRSIAADLESPVSTAVLSVSAFVLVLAVAMPITGWVGDRFGQKRVLVAALVLMVVAQLAASAAPGLGFLIATRAVQGLACSAIPPMVMGMLITFYPTQRLRMMGAWAAANGIGQAIGPPVGGLVSDLAGWRSVFVLMSAFSLLVMIGIWRSVPSIMGRETRLHLPGALLLSGGAGLLLLAMTVLSLAGVPWWLPALSSGLGVALLVGFVIVSTDNPTAMIPPHLMIEPRFLRSSLAAFGQMFMLGAVLVVMPLYLTGPLKLSPWEAGLLFFQLPLVMVLMAPLVSRLSDRFHPRRVLRAGLVTIILGGVLTGTLARGPAEPSAVWLTSVMLVVLGAGMAMVQTPAAAGASRSPAGSRGAALGLFNMLRFSGSTAGTAWVALTYHRTDMLALFLGAVAIAVLALAMTFFGPNPPDAAPDVRETRLDV